MKIFKHNKPDVVILCGGKGTRLRTVISDRPKPMAEVSGAPFLDRLIDYYASFGLTRFVLCTGFKGKFIKDRYSSYKTGLEILISHEKRPLGTAGAIKHAQSLIKSQNFIVLNGDSFSPVNISSMLDFHLKKKALITLALAKKKNSSDFGTVCLNNMCRITGFAEKLKSKSKGNLINLGIYVFQKKVLDMLPAECYYSLEYGLFMNLVKNRFFGYVCDVCLIDIGTPQKYRTANIFFHKQAFLHDK